MANTILTSDLVTAKSLANFVAIQSFLATSDRSFSGDFENSYYQAGDAINVRRRNKIKTSRGATATPSAITERSETLVIAPEYNAFMEFTAREQTLSLDRYNERYIEPAIQTLTADIETDIARQAALNTYYTIGTPGQSINSFNSVLSIFSMMGKLNMPTTTSYLALNLDDSQFLKASLQNAFNPILNQEISFGAQLGRLATFDIFQNACIYHHIAGTASALAPNTVTITNGPISQNNTFQLSGLPQILGNTDPDALKPGDVLQLSAASGVYWVSQLNRIKTNLVATFTVLTFTPGVAGAGTVTVTPDIISDSTNPDQNISQPIPNNATLTVMASHNVNIAYSAGGLSVVNPRIAPIQTPFSETKADKDALLSLNLSLAGDIYNMKNAFRITSLIGSKWHPEYCIRVVS